MGFSHSLCMSLLLFFLYILLDFSDDGSCHVIHAVLSFCFSEADYYFLGGRVCSQISLTFQIIKGCFGFFSESLGFIRHLISSVNKGNSLFLQGHWAAVIVCSNCRVQVYMAMQNIWWWKYFITMLMHSLYKALLKHCVIKLAWKVLELQMHAQSRTNKSPFTVSVSQASVGSKSNHVALLYNKSLSVICVLFFFGFVVVGAVFVVGADLELKVDAVLFFSSHFHCLHMLPPLMVCCVTAYPATAVVPCVEFNFSNVIVRDKPPSVAAGKCPP